MMALLLHSIVSLTLLLGCFLQAYSLWHGSARPLIPDISSQQAQQDEQFKRELPDLKKASLGDFPQTLSRPIFFEERQFPRMVEKSAQVPEPELAPPPPPPPDLDRDLKLLGVQIVDGTPKALIASGDSNAEWLSVGTAIGGWEVDRVDAEAVTLKAGSASHLLRLYDEQND